MAVEVLVEGRFAAVEGFPVVVFAERSDDEFQADGPLPLDMLFVFGEGLLEFGARFGGILQGVQKHIPIGLIQREGLVLVDYLVGCMQCLAEHEF